jgi:4-carboxymuconolactone decarboxylase
MKLMLTLTLAPFMPLAIALLLAAAMPAGAQDRMPPISPDRLTDEQKKAIDEFRAARQADISGPFVPLLRSPEVMNRARALGDYLRFRSVLPPRVSEFLILLTARSWTQQYEWFAHRQIALDAGVSAATVTAIAEGRRPAPMSDDEAAIYDYFDELDRHRSVSDATYARMVARFGEQGVIDAAGIIGYYTMLSIAMNTTRTAVPTSGAATALPVLAK